MLRNPADAFAVILWITCIGQSACILDWDEQPNAATSASQVEILADPGDTLLWFAADRGVETTQEGRVKIWADQSREHCDAKSSSPTSGPRVVERDGRPVVELDGTTELRLATVPAFTELSFFAVVSSSPDETRRCPSILHLSNMRSEISQTDRLDIRRQKQELLYQSGGDDRVTPGDGDPEGAFPPSSLHLLGVVHSAQGADQVAQLRIDARELRSQVMKNPLVVVDRDYNFIGHNHYHNDNSAEESCDAYSGQIAELLLFPRVLPDDERAALEHSLAQKWGVELW